MYGKPTAPIRDLAKTFGLEELFGCALCLGFWVGLVGGLALKDPLFAPACAGFCWAFDASVNALREVYLD